MNAFAEEKKLRLDLTAERQEMVALFDADRFMQVLRNLLSNAIKFSFDGSVVRMILNQSDEKLTCIVLNHGVGIPANELGTIFDKFVQSSKTRTGAGGTGLGLAICKEIVQQHGGKIWAESQLNAETRFIIELPLTRPQSNQKAA